MSLFEKDLLEISYRELLEILVSRKTRYKLNEVLANPCKSRFLKNIRAVKVEDDKCEYSVEFGVRVALAGISWIAMVAPETMPQLKQIASILLDIYYKHG